MSLALLVPHGNLLLAVKTTTYMSYSAVHVYIAMLAFTPKQLATFSLKLIVHPALPVCVRPGAAAL